jgi:aspartyl-tRNA(Asn)/glutamyl-tRNA(Gln) amidotransferase subunit B
MTASQLKTIIGLEVHVQLDTKSKMFCSCDNNSEGARPNTNVCEVCMGHPGTLPVANKQAIDWTILTGLALKCDIPAYSKFDRKNYFYPDLPKGYQISQYDLPFCANGYLEVDSTNGVKKIRLERIHLEEDAAKNMHAGTGGASYSLVDFNRSGIPLMEVVSKPDIETPEQARLYMQELQRILRYLGVSQADMEKGHMRCDANISIEDASGRSSGIVEVKNMNSFRNVERSLVFEQDRLRELLMSGEPISGKKVTRRWDDGRGETVLMREKEAASDYRYFPEPDIAPFTFTDEQIADIRRKLPELPREKRVRFVREYGLTDKQVGTLVDDALLAAYFEEVMSEALEWASSKKYDDKQTKRLIQLCTNYILSELLKHMHERDLAIDTLNVSAENFAELMMMTMEGQINSSATQKVLDRMIETGGDPSEIVANENLAQVSDRGELEAAVAQVIAAHPGPADDYRNGKQQAIQFLVGMVMKETKGKANPQLVRELLEEALK